MINNKETLYRRVRDSNILWKDGMGCLDIALEAFDFKGGLSTERATIVSKFQCLNRSSVPRSSGISCRKLCDTQVNRNSCNKHTCVEFNNKRIKTSSVIAFNVWQLRTNSFIVDFTPTLPTNPWHTDVNAQETCSIHDYFEAQERIKALVTKDSWAIKSEKTLSL